MISSDLFYCGFVTCSKLIGRKIKLTRFEYMVDPGIRYNFIRFYEVNCIL